MSNAFNQAALAAARPSGPIQGVRNCALKRSVAARPAADTEPNVPSPDLPAPTALAVLPFLPQKIFLPHVLHLTYVNHRRGRPLLLHLLPSLRSSFASSLPPRPTIPTATPFDLLHAVVYYALF